MAKEIWRASCEECRAVVGATVDSVRRDDEDGTSRFTLTCGRCGKVAVYVRPPLPAPGAKPPKTGRSRVREWAGLALSAFAVLAVLNSAGHIVRAAGRAFADKPAPLAYTRDGVKTPAPPRRDVELLFKGRTEAFVLDTLKRPSQTQQTGGGSIWYYDGFTYDPVAAKLDTWTVFHFDNGVVTHVSFF